MTTGATAANLLRDVRDVRNEADVEHEMRKIWTRCGRHYRCGHPGPSLIQDEVPGRACQDAGLKRR